MSPLLIDPRIALYNLIILQELQQNLYYNRIYCLSILGFILVYNNKQYRSCFLINRCLNPIAQSVEYLSLDLAVFCLQVEDCTVQIYNIYNPPLGSYSIDQYNTPISLLPDLISRDRDYLILSNFNLHYLIQYSPCNPTAYKAADCLIDLILLYNLALASLKGGVIWEVRGQLSMIDLTFLSPRLREQIVRCEIREDLDFSTNHYPILTSLLLYIIQVSPILQQSWKRMDLEAV